jgi:putative membrane protein
MGMGYGHMGFYGISWTMLGMVIFWVILFVIGFFLIKSFIYEKPRQLDSLELLNIRLVKGEITEEEYIRLKDIIKK